MSIRLGRYQRATAFLLVHFLVLTSVVGAQDAAPAMQAAVIGSQTIDATGQGAVQLHLHLADSAGNAFPKGTSVRAVILQGDARLSAGLSADAATDSGSTISLTVYPGTRTGPLVIRVDAGNATADVTLALTADIRKPLVVGFATGGIGPVPGWIEATDNAPDGTTARRGAISIFGTGEISRNTRGTFAYDSSDTLEQTLLADPFLDNPNDRPFSTYGDASIRRDDALSTNHIFGSIQNGRSSAMWGQFFAQAAPSTAVGGYNILVNGGQLTAGGNNVVAAAFTAKNNTAYARQVISPTGLAISSQALQPDIVIGSDVLTLVHLDKRTGAIVSQSFLARGSDYVIDYASGLLRFVNIILPYDDNLNPQIVVVQYQYGGPGASSTMVGGSATAKIGPGARADAWYLNDSIGSGNLTFLGESLSGSAAGTSGIGWSVSHERSVGFLPLTTTAYGGSGDAYQAALAGQSKTFKFSLAFASTDAAYDNPFGSYTAPGLQSLNATAGFVLGPVSVLELHYLEARNNLPATLASQTVNNADQQAGIALRVTPSKRLTYKIGLEADSAYSNGTVNPLLFAAGGTQAPSAPNTWNGFLPTFGSVSSTAGSGHAVSVDASADWRFAPRASLGLTRLQPLGSVFDPYDPPQTQAEFDLDVGKDGKLFVRQLWQQGASQALAATQAGQTYAGTAQSQTSVGFEQRVGPTTYETGYSVEHTANGTDLFDAIGMRTKLLVSPRLNADGFVQVGNSLYSTYASNSSPFFLAVGTSLDYSLKTFHATGQVQVRTGYDSGSSFQLGATGPISPAVSLFGSYTGSYTIGEYDTEGRGGLAYRPSRNDRYVTLLSLDIYHSTLTNYDAYITNVAQLQELYRSSTRTEWAASVAYKLTGDSYFSPGTAIYGVRGDQRIGSRFDLASEAHWSDVAPISGTNATGFAVEAGYRIGSTLRLAGGYNFSGFADPDTAVSPTHRGFYVTLSTYIDRIFGWGQDH